ncbi:hypothetical protein AM571_PC01564 (plasmid) [Rhizobium etli 8C-3]|uniref:Uncharacterized protein n=1 Tax=Rhizobium etli 8C-3 TaxID=538025 RepID=A0A1L5PGT5_RHIET|nr:hypothetical protein AM571_PC01564 [Rhizobium etli 8C-3]
MASSDRHRLGRTKTPARTARRQTTKSSRMKDRFVGEQINKSIGEATRGRLANDKPPPVADPRHPSSKEASAVAMELKVTTIAYVEFSIPLP